MAFLGPISLIRMAVAVGFVWVAFPHQPDLGFGRPPVIATLVADTTANGCTAKAASSCGGGDVTAFLGSVANMEHTRDAVMQSLERVRADLRANASPIGSLNRN
ncbi:MAG TPA: hypothetical protein VGB91_08015 [Rhizomicrobium sp.]